MAEAQNQCDFLRLAANSLDQAIVATDLDGRVEFANEAYVRLLGHLPGDLINRRVDEILPDFGDVKETLTHALAKLKKVGAYKGDILVYNRCGEPRWVTMTANVVVDDSREAEHIVATMSDITFAKIHETLQHRLLHDFVQGNSLNQIMDVVCREVQKLVPNIHMSVSLIDERGRLNVQAAPNLPGWYCDAIAGLQIGPVTGSCGTAAWSGQPVNVADIHSNPLWAPYRDIIAPLDYKAVWSTPIKSAGGDVKGVFAFYSVNPIEPNALHWHIVNICTQLCRLLFERMEAQERVRFLAQQDSLTGLHNRGYFQEELSKQIELAKCNGSSFAVHLIDLDGFKDVNDRYGHLASDAVLANVAKALGGAVRACDTLARLGGDEFALLQKDISGPRDAQQCATRLIAAAEAALCKGARSITTSASIGYARFPADGDHAAALFRNADLALYDAKQRGRGRASSYLSSMTRKIEEHRRLQDALRAVLANDDDDFFVVFQPQFRLADLKLVGFEALARWHHPELGMIKPETFIPIAEQGDLICQLGQRVLRQACREASTWPDQLSVAVNFSPAQFNEVDLPQLVQSVLLETQLSPRRLELEVTENLLIGDMNKALHILRRLSAMGIRIALDDFGTGYASLSYLHTFPFDKIKIDRSFVMNLEENRHSRAIVDAVLGMCKAIGVPVIAEGLETAEQFQMLSARECDYGQGFFLSPPVEDVAVFLTQGNCEIETQEACRATPSRPSVTIPQLHGGERRQRVG